MQVLLILYYYKYSHTVSSILQVDLMQSFQLKTALEKLFNKKYVIGNYTLNERVLTLTLILNIYN